MERAAWVPGWYELDQPLEVGLEAEFIFWRIVPDYLRRPERLVFYNDTWRPEKGVFAQGKIARIRHPELGEIRKVDTRGLDYKITLLDGTMLAVNAEEDPGKIYEGQPGASVQSPRLFSDWTLEVEFESISETYTERRNTEPAAPPNGGPAKPSGNLGVSDGPPSVS